MHTVSIALLAVTALVAQVGFFSNATPPVRYRHNATLTVDLQDQAAISRTCQSLFGRPPPGAQTNACFTGERAILPNPCTFPKSDIYAHLLCHELAHRNGWPATHGP